ncbi:hypothetical protein NXW84_23395 [Bacteroides fragilis]|nr:hypothetical protein NXW84_23395 [Bacteroides fragilis]
MTGARVESFPSAIAIRMGTGSSGGEAVVAHTIAASLREQHPAQ